MNRCRAREVRRTVVRQRGDAQPCGQEAKNGQNLSVGVPPSLGQARSVTLFYRLLVLSLFEAHSCLRRKFLPPNFLPRRVTRFRGKKIYRASLGLSRYRIFNMSYWDIDTILTDAQVWLSPSNFRRFANVDLESSLYLRAHSPRIGVYGG